MIRQGGDDYTSNVTTGLICDKYMVNEGGRGVVNPSWPCDDREKAMREHRLKIFICELVLGKVQNVHIEIRNDLNFAVFVIFI